MYQRKRFVDHPASNSTYASPQLQSSLPTSITQALDLYLDSTSLGVTSCLESINCILEVEPVSDQVAELDDTALD